MSGQRYHIPDLLSDWPWARRLSPHYADCKAESSAWVHSYRPFDARGQKSFDACDLNLLASLTYSNRNKDFVRLGCDLMNFYFIYDEYTDIADEHLATELAENVLDVMKNPTTALPPSSHLLAKMTKDFCVGAANVSPLSSNCFKRFLRTSEGYLHAVIAEARHRASSYRPTVEEYMVLRRDTCGARPTLVLTEFGLDLPDYVTSHPVVSSLMEDAVDLIIFVNDMHSYRREAASGLAAGNVLTAIMNNHDLDLQSALDFLKTLADETSSRFLRNLHNVPSWGADVDEKVKVYLDGLGQWVRGNDDWSYESKRYYGNEGPAIRTTRTMTLKGGSEVANYLQTDVTEPIPPAPAPSYQSRFSSPMFKKTLVPAFLIYWPWVALLWTLMY